MQLTDGFLNAVERQLFRLQPSHTAGRDLPEIEQIFIQRLLRLVEARGPDRIAALDVPDFEGKRDRCWTHRSDCLPLPLVKANEPSGYNRVRVDELPETPRPRFGRARRHQRLHLAHLTVGDELPGRALRHRRIELSAYERFVLILGAGRKRYAIFFSAGD